MNEEQLEINYDEFFHKPINERIELFTAITAENRSFLVKTQAERWLAHNRSRLTDEQISIAEEIVQSISPEWYKTSRDSEKVAQRAEALLKKAEAVLSHEDLLQFASRRAEYIAIVEDKND